MDYRELRYQMVEGQIRARGIMDEAIIKAMRKVPRHEFVPDDVIERAYDDCPLPIGEGQTISQPYIVALMTQGLNLNKKKRVLEIGTGSGYQTAILAELGKEVCSIERIEALAQRAEQIIHELKYTNAKIYLGDGSMGLLGDPQFFDAIIVTAASPEKPERLLRQLTQDGRLVVPIGGRLNQVLMLYTKTKDQIVEEAVCGCTFVPLIGKNGWPPD